LTEFEDRYRRLIATDPARRKPWLAAQLSTEATPAFRWVGLIEAAVSDVLWTLEGQPVLGRPRADIELAADLIDWALEDGYPVEHAIEQLALLVRAAVNAGQHVEDLPPILRPDNVLRLALQRMPLTRDHALTRAAELRAIPLTEDDFYNLVKTQRSSAP
jgi:hypothetical protein